MSDEQIVLAARNWYRAREEALRLRAQRAEIVCEFEEAGDPADPAIGYGGSPPTPACWRGEEWDDDMKPLEEAKWCTGCLLRQTVHRAYMAANKRRGAALRALIYRLGRDAR